ncbi:MAG: hypothetical protein JW990_04060 [Thermoleophilia bacterium]|nr:hypothetical protein [Thermoleophilia bacterium]
MQVLRVVLGETCSRFRPGPDAGRDGWFKGIASGKLVDEAELRGNFVVQCKHTSDAHNPLSLSHLNDEVKKVTALAAGGGCHYLLMTNRQVSAGGEMEIREAFEKIPGVGKCLVLNETWVEDTVDAHPRLLRLVPRLYGIGDLSQILSFAIHQQTTALLEDLAFPLRTFVPTESYRRAERALHEHGFVVLVGPPASGKSSIAANLCMVSMAQAPDTRVLRIEHAEQFKSTWSPADANTIYWVDDVFGETTLDAGRLREWSAALEKVEAARRRMARIIFCTRDYILAAAERLIKRSKADFINDARVRVDVAALSDAERDAILYNHIKEGDISRERKRALKKHLSSLARLSSFSPELARRLGNERITAGLRAEWEDLRRFFDYPVRHFSDVIHGLSGSETGALAVCLLSNNSVPDPVPDDAVAQAVCSTYGISVQQIGEALELLEGSLVKRVRHETSQTWQVHHPSMIEALQDDLTTKASKVVLYLKGAQIGALLRDTTTLVPPSNSRLVFLPESVYEHLTLRLVSDPKAIESIAEYLASRASDKLLRELDARSASTLDHAIGIMPEPFSSDASPALAVRLSLVAGGSLLTDGRRSILEKALRESIDQCGWLGFIDVPQFSTQFPDLVHELLAGDVEADFASVGALYDWHAQDLSSRDHLESAEEDLQNHARRLRKAMEGLKLSSPSALSVLEASVAHAVQTLEERKAELVEAEEQRADAHYDEWKEQQYEERDEIENGRYADVDE